MKIKSEKNTVVLSTAKNLILVFASLFLIFSSISCEALQDTLSSEQSQKLTEESGTPSYATSEKVWYYNGLSTDDMSEAATKLSDDYYDQSFLISFGKKVAISELSGSIEVLYLDSDGYTITKTFSKLSGSFTSDYTGYRLDMSEVLKLFDGTTIPSGNATMTVSATGFVCAEGSQNGRALSKFSAKGIALEPLYSSTALAFSTIGYSLESDIEFELNGNISLENGSYDATAAVISSGTGETKDSYDFNVSAKDNKIIIKPKSSDIPANETTVLLTITGILPEGAGHSVSKDIKISFSKYKIVIDGIQDTNFLEKNGALVVEDSAEDQDAFAELGYSVTSETDLSQIFVTNDDEYVYVGVFGSLALTWSNPLVIQISNGTVTGSSGAYTTVKSADTENYKSVSRKKIQPNVYICHQPGVDNSGAGVLSAFAFVSSTNTDISSLIKYAPVGWTSDTVGSFLEYAIPLGDSTGLYKGDTLRIIVTASLGWNEGYAVVDACPDSAIEYENTNHTSVTYNFNEGISYEIQ